MYQIISSGGFTFLDGIELPLSLPVDADIIIEEKVIRVSQQTLLRLGVPCPRTGFYWSFIKDKEIIYKDEDSQVAGSGVKIKLLNSGGFSFLSHLDFPIEVNGIVADGGFIVVESKELARIGAKTNTGLLGLEEWDFLSRDIEVIE